MMKATTPIALLWLCVGIASEPNSDAGHVLQSTKSPHHVEAPNPRGTWPEQNSVKSIRFYAVDWTVDYFADLKLEAIVAQPDISGDIQGYGREAFLFELNAASGKLNWAACPGTCYEVVRTVIDFTMNDGTRHRLAAGPTGVVDVEGNRRMPLNSRLRRIFTFGWLDHRLK
jgi:hypothetical protein